jgi:hypothetical protein
MIVDSQLLFSDAQAITAAAGSTNTVDLGSVRDIGTGESLYVVVTVDIALTGASVTLVVDLEGDSTTTITPDATSRLFTIPALAAAGGTYIASLDPGMDALQYQYVRLKYTPTGGAGSLSTGTVTAFITKNPQSVKYYADAVTISS